MHRAFLLTALIAAICRKSSALQDVGRVTVVSVTANGWDERTTAEGCSPNGCTAENTRDGSTNPVSRWSCKAELLDDNDQNHECELTFGFEDPQDIAKVRIAFYKGDERTRELKVKANGFEFATIESSGETADYEDFDLNAEGVSSIVLESLGLADKEWISFTEVEFMVEGDILTPSSESPSPGYPDPIGCFKDTADDRVFTAKTSSNTMTPTVCAEYCAAASPCYTYYATQWGRECWCAEAGIDYSRHGDGTCEAPCSGDETIVCGGTYAFTMYELYREAPPPTPAPFPLTTWGDEYVGCFADDAIDRVLGDKYSTQDLTPEVCADRCLAMDKMFFGLQWGIELRCELLSDAGGNFYSRHGNGTCNYSCEGDSSYACGGHYSFSLYKPGNCDAECTMEASGGTTTMGGTPVTLSSSCGFESAVFNVTDGNTFGIIVAGEIVDASTARIISPPLPAGTSRVMVTATSATDETMVDILDVFGLGTLIEWGSLVNTTTDGGKTRTTVITDPPSDLVLNWDPSLMGAEAVHVTLAKVVGDDEIEDVVTIGDQSNTGSFVVSMDVLGGLGLQNDSYVMFKIVGGSSVRRLQDDGLTPIAFPTIITTGLLAWLATVPEVVGLEACKSFSDNESRCQCFFSTEKERGGGIQLDAFASSYRCPSNVACILEPPSDLISDELITGWTDDSACPLDECLFEENTETGESTLVSCKQKDIPWYMKFVLDGPCQFHPGATFCARTDGATNPAGNAMGNANQCCFDADGNLVLDVTTGGGTVDKVQSGLLDYAFFKGHDLEDVQPFNWCCSDLSSWLCMLYIEMRPVDAGDGYANPICNAAPSGGDPVTRTETFSVYLPALASSAVDFGLLVDVSGSYSDDIANLKILAPQLMEGLRVDAAGVERDLRLALASFADHPDYGGSSSDSPYTIEKAFASCGSEVDIDEVKDIEEIAECQEEDREAWVSAVDSLSIMDGGDFSESQSIALFRAATDWTWSVGALKILAITTDATFHTKATADVYFDLDEIIDVCVSKNIKILALKASGAGTEMDTLAEATSGVVKSTTSDSSDIVTEILQGVEEVKYNVVDVEWACRDSDFEESVWTHTQTDAYENVQGDLDLEFTVSVTAPGGVRAGVKCVALVVADEVLIGGRQFEMMEDGSISVAPITSA